MFKYFFKLLRELGGYAWQNKAWWIIPIAITLLLLMVVVVATQGGILSSIYALF